MAKKDPRREDLILPYQHVIAKPAAPPSVLSSSLPLAAMFLRNKLLAWAAFFTAIQTFLNEPTLKPKDYAEQPGWMTLGLSFVGVITCYFDIVMPKAFPKPPATPAEAAADPVPVPE